MMILRLLQQETPFSTVFNKAKDAKTASAHSTKRRETLLTTKRQLQNALALTKVHCITAVVELILKLQ